MKTLAFVLILSLLAGCSSPPAPEEKQPDPQTPSIGASIEAKQLAAQMNSDEVAEVNFIPQTAKLTTLSQKQLKDGIETALSHGRLERIAVISWADEEYPSPSEPKLSKEQRKLVDARNYAIKEILRKYDEKPIIRLYSMAERPSTVDKFLSNRDFKIKKSLEQAGIPNTDTSVKVPAMSSKAIVLFKNLTPKPDAK